MGAETIQYNLISYRTESSPGAWRGSDFNCTADFEDDHKMGTARLIETSFLIGSDQTGTYTHGDDQLTHRFQV